jgi:hypothetical protein
MAMAWWCSALNGSPCGSMASRLIALEGVLEHLQGQLDAFAHLLDVLVVGWSGPGQLQAVDRQQVAGEFFQRELVGLVDILLGAADVLQIGSDTQGLILRGGQLLFELLNTGAVGCSGLFGVQVLRISCSSAMGSPPQFL